MPQTSKSTISSDFASYSEVAGEYYDPVLHPTCANFRTASKLLLTELGVLRDVSCKSILELGAGRSLVAEMLIEKEKSLDRLVITDKHEEMLLHSRIFESAGAKLKIFDACSANLSLGKFDLIVAVLADPYNTKALWRNLSRLCSRRGLIALTFPSYYWMKSYRVLREHVESQYSVFQTGEGRSLNLPSFILPTEQVIECGRSAELILIEHRTFRLARLTAERISPKLLSPGDAELPIVEAYLFQNNSLGSSE